MYSGTVSQLLLRESAILPQRSKEPEKFGNHTIFLILHWRVHRESMHEAYPTNPKEPT